MKTQIIIKHLIYMSKIIIAYSSDSIKNLLRFLYFCLSTFFLLFGFSIVLLFL